MSFCIGRVFSGGAATTSRVVARVGGTAVPAGVVVALVLVVALDLSREPAPEGTLQVKDLRYFLVVEYILRSKRRRDE